MPYDVEDPRLVFLPESEVAVASGLCDVMRDRWFCVHPERGLVFIQEDMRRRKGSLKGATPFCNGDESLARRIQATVPWAEIKLIPLVIVPINVNDYV